MDYESICKHVRRNGKRAVYVAVWPFVVAIVFCSRKLIFVVESEVHLHPSSLHPLYSWF